MTFNASDEGQVKAAAKAAKRKETRQEAALRGLMSKEEGRSWMFDLLAKCHIFQTSMNTNALQMAFAEGERNIGLVLYADLTRLCPNEYLLMLTERNEDAGRDNNVG